MTKFIEKLLPTIFKPVSTSWAYSVLMWCIDTRYRTYTWVSQWVSDQIEACYLPDGTGDQNNILVKLAEHLRGADVYATIFNIEEYVYQHLSYETDLQQYGADDYWEPVMQTLTNGKGDCENINGLIYILCRLNGIYEGLWCAIGKTSGGYHFWVLCYLFNEDKLVSLDATFYPKVIPVRDKLPFAVNDKYLSVDYVFNDTESYKNGGK